MQYTQQTHEPRRMARMAELAASSGLKTKEERQKELSALRATSFTLGHEPLDYRTALRDDFIPWPTAPGRLADSVKADLRQSHFSIGKANSTSDPQSIATETFTWLTPKPEEISMLNASQKSDLTARHFEFGRACNDSDRRISSQHESFGPLPPNGYEIVQECYSAARNIQATQKQISIPFSDKATSYETEFSENIAKDGERFLSSQVATGPDKAAFDRISKHLRATTFILGNESLDYGTDAAQMDGTQLGSQDVALAAKHLKKDLRQCHFDFGQDDFKQSNSLSREDY